MPQTSEILRAQNNCYILGVVSAASSQLVNGSINIYPTWGMLLEISEGGRIFRLNQPLVITRFAESGYICLEHKELGILSFGRSEAEAVNAFREDFGALWDGIAQAKDSALTREAKTIKKKFLKVVNSVVPE
jgi:hypothetical protein